MKLPLYNPILSPSLADYYGAAIELIVWHGWKTIALISENTSYYNKIDKVILRMFERSNVTVGAFEKVSSRREMEATVAAIRRNLASPVGWNACLTRRSKNTRLMARINIKESSSGTIRSAGIL